MSRYRNEGYKMVLLHSGMTEDTGRTVIGYAVREKGKLFIVLKDGTREAVRLDTVTVSYTHLTLPTILRV